MKKNGEKKDIKYLDADMIADFGKRVATLREEQGIKACRLADDLGMTPANLSRIERGEQFCKIDNIVLIAQHLNTSIDYLLFGCVDEGIVGRVRDLIQKVDPMIAEKALRYFQASLEIEVEDADSKGEGGASHV